MMVIETERLVLREFTCDDAAFIVRLLNERSFIDNIGDRKVRTLEDAVRYLEQGPLASYAQHGHGLWMVERAGTPIGMCGLLRRAQLPEVDVGYALLPEYCGQGYAREAVAATLAFAQRRAMGRVLAVVSPGNEPSIRLLEKLGFCREGRVRLAPDLPHIELFALSLSASS